MGKDTLTLKKNTPATPDQATQEKTGPVLDAKPAQASAGAAPETNEAHVDDQKTGAIKTDSTALNSTPMTDNASEAKKTADSAGDKAGETAKGASAEPTKMETATAIYLEMKKTKGVTRKEILERFVAEAKLSKAGASTYFQLIKAKHP